MTGLGVGPAQGGRGEAYREPKNGKEGCQAGEVDSQSPGKHGRAARVEQRSLPGGGRVRPEVTHGTHQQLPQKQESGVDS